MNPIAQEAISAITKAGYPTRNNLCQKFARLVVEKVVGGKPMGTPNPETAKDAAHRLLAQGHAFLATDLAKHGGLQPGDVLYKTQGSGGNGHVGIYVGEGQVAENSTVHWKKSGGVDARGIRSLAAFGAFQVVARFPVPATPQKSITVPHTSVEPFADPHLIVIWNGVHTTLEDIIEKQGHKITKVTEKLEGEMPRVWVNSTPNGGGK